MLYLLLSVLGLVLLIVVGKHYNRIDWGHGWVNILDGCLRWYCKTFHQLRGEDLQLPQQGAAIVVCNHISGLDPLLLLAHTRRPLRFLIAREEYERFYLKPLFRAVGCIPVDRSGRPDTALRYALKALEQGEVVAIFPQGRIALRGEKTVPLKGGAVSLAKKSRSLIYPARISGVSGHGFTLLALFIPSLARLQAFAPVDVSHKEIDEGIETLAQLLDQSH